MHAHNFKDLTGLRFYRRVVLRYVGTRTFGSLRSKQSFWLTRCDCGTEAEVSSGNLKRIKSCGCWCREISGVSRRLPNNIAALNLNISKYKSSAEKRNLIWALTDDDFQKITSSVCYYCGSEPRQFIKHLNWSKYRDPVPYNGIDRVDNSRGYELNNVVPCCKICNTAKHALTQEEFLSWLQRAAEHMRSKGNATPTQNQ